MTKQEELDRCDREIETCKADMATDEWALLGWRDWRVEKTIIQKEVDDAAAGKCEPIDKGL